jgi:protein-L-isoaspartate(D-aspartate) O-methyltransferase
VLLALLARVVYSVERHASLAQLASATLAGLGIRNVHITVGDGSQGWREHSPYDAILVSAAAPVVPYSLREQLSENGRIVIPVGTQHTQRLQILRKTDGQFTTENLEDCRFVPLIGSEGF